MAKYSFTWAVERFNGAAWRVEKMDTETSDTRDPVVFGEAKRVELAQADPDDGWSLADTETGALRLRISGWGPYQAPKRERASA